MGNITIRNLDDRVIDAWKAGAKANHRSLEAELRCVLTQRANRGLRMAEFRDRADRIAAATAGTPQTDSADLIGRTATARRARPHLPSLPPGCHPGLVPGSSHAAQADPGVEPGFPGHSGPWNKSGVTLGGAETVSLRGAEPRRKPEPDTSGIVPG